MMYQSVRTTYCMNMKRSTFAKDWAPGRYIWSRPKAIEGVLLRVLIYPNGVTEESRSHLSFFVENLSDVRLEVDVEVKLMGKTEIERIIMNKRSSQGIRKFMHHDQIFRNKAGIPEDEIVLEYTIKGFWKELNRYNDNNDSVAQKTLRNTAEILNRMPESSFQKNKKPRIRCETSDGEHASHLDNVMTKSDVEDNKREGLLHWQTLTSAGRKQLIASMTLPFCRICKNKLFGVIIKQCKNGHLACGMCCANTSTLCSKCNEGYKLRDAFQKKTPYGGTLSQLGGEGVKINFKMSLLKLPFSVLPDFIYDCLVQKSDQILTYLLMKI